MRLNLRGMVALGVCLSALALLLPADGEIVFSEDFEKGTFDGRTGPGTNVQIVDGKGFDGSRGLVFANENPAIYTWAERRLALKVGEHYRFSVWVRADGLKSGKVQIALTWTTKAGKWIGMHRAEPTNEKCGAWVKYAGLTPKLPDEAGIFSVQVALLPKGVLGTVVLDDLVISHRERTLSAELLENGDFENPLDKSWSVPAPDYRIVDGVGIGGSRALFFEKNVVRPYVFPRQVVPVKPGKVYRYEAYVKHVLKDGRVRVSMEWVSTNGVGLNGNHAKPVHDNDVTAKEGWQKWVGYTPRMPADAGRADMLVYADRGATGYILADNVSVTEMSVEKPQVRVRKARGPGEKPRRVELDRYGRTIVNGKPFFPIGMYATQIDKAELDVYCRAPFTFISSYREIDDAAIREIRKHGLMYGYTVKNCYVGRREGSGPKLKTNADADRRVTEIVNHLKDDPSLLYWYTGDEEPVGRVPELTARYRLIQSLDDDHPQLGIFDKPHELDEFVGCYDILGTDPYPVGFGRKGTRISMVSDWCREVRRRTGPDFPLWHAPQAFDWSTCFPCKDVEQRMPTRAEMRNICWQEIAAGANGLAMYAFFEIRKQFKGEAFDRVWSDVIAVTREIRDHEALLLSEPGPAATCEDKEIGVRTWQTGGRVRTLVVNASTEKKTATVKIGGETLAVSLNPLDFKIVPEKGT